MTRREFDDPNAEVVLWRRDQTQHVRHLHPALGAVNGDPSKNLAYMRLLGQFVTVVHDELMKEHLNTGAPLHQFLRHFRNACAHGNRWHFTTGAPTKPAHFRSFSLDSSMHGAGPVLFDHLFPGDVADLLDDVKASL